jgi:serine O-acetyltransferase
MSVSPPSSPEGSGSLRRTLSFIEREKALGVIQQYTPSHTMIKELRRNFSLTNLQAPLTLSWEMVRQEAIEMITKDKFLEPYYTERIIRHDNFSDAIQCCIAESFECNAMSRMQWVELFQGCYNNVDAYHDGKATCEYMGLADLAAVAERDPSATNFVRPFLYFKGYRAIQAHRISHVLWHKGRQDASLLIQSRMCELWSVDIHPASIIDCGLMIDHGTGVVIGETAVIGSNCSFLHGVTLGSSGKDRGDRHPKLGNDILVGCGATILGNITIGSNTKIGSGSIVLKSLPCCVTAVGNPARIVGKSTCVSAANSMDLAMQNVKYCHDINKLNAKGSNDTESDTLTLCPLTVFVEVDKAKREKLNKEEVGTATGLRFGLSPPAHIMDVLFKDSDSDNDGYLSYTEYEEFTLQLISFTTKVQQHQPLMEEWEKYVNDSPTMCMYLIARARLDLDSIACAEKMEFKEESKERSGFPKTLSSVFLATEDNFET